MSIDCKKVKKYFLTFRLYSDTIFRSQFNIRPEKKRSSPEYQYRNAGICNPPESRIRSSSRHQRRLHQMRS